MTTIKTDDSGEWAWVDGDLVLEEDPGEEVRQTIATVLRLTRGEAQMDQEAGLDSEILFGAGVTTDEIAQHIGDVIRDVPGAVFVHVPTVTLDTSTRRLTVAYEAEWNATDLGERRKVADTITIDL